MVVATGQGTEMGKIQQGVQAAKEDAERTPLAQKLDDFGERLTWAIGAICLAVWAINIRNFNQPAFGTAWRGARVCGARNTPMANANWARPCPIQANQPH